MAAAAGLLRTPRAFTTFRGKSGTPTIKAGGGLAWDVGPTRDGGKVTGLAVAAD